MPRTRSRPPDPATDAAARESPLYWFAILEMAKDRGLFERAAEAKRELERLGVHVSYRRPGNGQAGGARHGA
jgi:hypothetical protein